MYMISVFCAIKIIKPDKARFAAMKDSIFFKKINLPPYPNAINTHRNTDNSFIRADSIIGISKNIAAENNAPVTDEAISLLVSAYVPETTAVIFTRK